MKTMKLDSHQVVFVLRVEHEYKSVDEMLAETNSLSTEPLNDSKKESREKETLLFHLHDLRSGLNFTFKSWQEIQDYIKEQSQKGLR